MIRPEATQPVLLDSYEAAQFLGLRHPGTLCNWRSNKKGPPFVRIGGKIRYIAEDLRSWIEEHRVTATG
jgi:hypothetical protein